VRPETHLGLKINRFCNFTLQINRQRKHYCKVVEYKYKRTSLVRIANQLSSIPGDIRSLYPIDHHSRTSRFEPMAPQHYAG